MFSSLGVFPFTTVFQGYKLLYTTQIHVQRQFIHEPKSCFSLHYQLAKGISPSSLWGALMGGAGASWVSGLPMKPAVSPGNGSCSILIHHFLLTMSWTPTILWHDGVWQNLAQHGEFHMQSIHGLVLHSPRSCFQKCFYFFTACIYTACVHWGTYSRISGSCCDSFTWTCHWLSMSSLSTTDT